MNETLADLANSRFTELTEAERRTLHAATTGVPAICGPSNNDQDARNDPSDNGNWHPSRAIRAEFLEWLCTTEIASEKVDRQGIHIYAARICGILRFAYSTIPFPLLFQLCAFTEDISFKNARIPSLILTSCSTRAILADGIDVANNVLLNGRFHSSGQVLFRNAKVGGDFRTDGGTFKCTPGASFDLRTGNALGCDRIRVNGSVFLSHSSSPSNFSGEVGFAGAWIGSNLECDGGTFRNLGKDKFAIRADRVTVVGSVFLRNQFTAEGVVRFLNATIGILDCTRGRFLGNGLTALNVEGSSIAGMAVLDLSFASSGGTQLRGIDVEDLSFLRGEFDSVDLRQAKIHRVFRWKEIVGPQETDLDLRDATIGSIEDDESSWPGIGYFHAEGLTYGDFTNCSREVDQRLKWINRDPSESPRAYKQLASVYSKAGETGNSREALYRLEELVHSKQTKSIKPGILKPLLFAWSQWLKWTIGYGYKLERAFFLTILLTVAGTFVSGWGYQERVIVPTDKDAYAYFAIHGQAPSSYQRFSSVMYSIEHSVPAINLGISSNWTSNPVAQLPGLPKYSYKLRWWFWLQALLGWGLSIFFIAGLTGLVKSDR
ncbi:MAG TPA: hypothetical protein VFB43_10680 [Terracidiphilus sp.]|nr:hypothetical protein [Terracidiphilus sp.]